MESVFRFGECLDHLKHAEALAGSQIVDAYVRLGLSQFIDCFYVTDGQIHDVNVVTDTCSIRCIVVIAEYAHFLQFAYGNLGDVWS